MILNCFMWRLDFHLEERHTRLQAHHKLSVSTICLVQDQQLVLPRARVMALGKLDILNRSEQCWFFQPAKRHSKSLSILPLLLGEEWTFPLNGQMISLHIAVCLMVIL